MARGHADKATINSRKALSGSMQALLDRLRGGAIASQGLSQMEKNSMRALEGRGYVWWSIETKKWNITGAGLSLIDGIQPSVSA